MVCKVALTVRGFEKRTVDKGLTCGCAFKWLKIGGQSKEVDNLNFWMGRGEGRVRGHFVGILRVGEGIWVGFFSFPKDGPRGSHYFYFPSSHSTCHLWSLFYHILT